VSDELNDSSAETLGIGVVFQEFVFQMHVPPPGEVPVRYGRPATGDPIPPADGDSPTA